MDIAIDITFSKLGVNSTKPYLKLSQGLAPFQLTQEGPFVDIEIDQGELRVDGTVTREDIGIYSALKIGTTHYQKYWEHGLLAIGQMAADGDYLAMIERGHTIPDLVFEKSKPQEREVNIHFKRGPSIDFRPGGVTFHPIPGDLNLHTKPYQLKQTYEPGKVSSYLIQKGSVEIRYTGKRLDIAL